MKTIRFFHRKEPPKDPVAGWNIIAAIERNKRMLKLYYSPGTCSLAAHIALREGGLLHERQLVRLEEGEQLRQEYKDIHPMGRVPALKLGDGAIVTEVSAILSYVAWERLDLALLPREGLEQVRAVEWMGMLSAGAHPAVWGFVRPSRFTEDKSAQEKIKEESPKRFFEMLEQVEARLNAGAADLVRSFPLLDAYTFVFYLWGLRLKLPVQELCEYTRLAQRVAQREATRAALEAEGLSTVLQLPVFRAEKAPAN